jgi:hypothetical protein
MADKTDKRDGETSNLSGRRSEPRSAQAYPAAESATAPGFQEEQQASPAGIREGKEIYRSLKEKLESQHYGSYVMIEARTEQYVLGATTSEVHSKFIERFGIDAPGWCTRIGVSIFATA